MRSLKARQRISNHLDAEVVATEGFQFADGGGCVGAVDVLVAVDAPGIVLDDVIATLRVTLEGEGGLKRGGG